MSAANKAIAERIMLEMWNEGNLGLADQLFARDYVSHDPANRVQGTEGVKQLVTKYRTAFPDTHFTIEEMIAEGDKVVTRWKAEGTHRGVLEGIAATGKRVTVAGVTVSRIVNGKVAEDWPAWDALGMMQQLGAIPAAAHG